MSEWEQDDIIGEQLKQIEHMAYIQEDLIKALKLAINWDGCDSYEVPAVWLKDAQAAIERAES